MESLTYFVRVVLTDPVFFLLVFTVPSLAALLSSRHLKLSSTDNTRLSRYFYAWSKFILDTGLVWGIALSCAGLIGMAVNLKESEGLAESITTALAVMVWVGTAAGLAYVIDRKELAIQLRFTPIDLVIMSAVIAYSLGYWISITGVPFWGRFFHPTLTSCQFALIAILFLVGRKSSKPWRDLLFEANLGVTLVLMALGITIWFLDWSDFENSKESIWLIANILFWGGILHMIFYCGILLTGKGTDAKIRTKSWHFTEAFAFYTFLVYAPIGTTEYFRESADQKALQEQHEDQQSEIDELKARIQRLEELQGN